MMRKTSSVIVKTITTQVINATETKRFIKIAEHLCSQVTQTNLWFVTLNDHNAL